MRSSRPAFAPPVALVKVWTMTNLIEPSEQHAHLIQPVLHSQCLGVWTGSRNAGGAWRVPASTGYHPAVSHGGGK